MTRWLHILIPVTLGAVAYAIMRPEHWDEIRQGLMFALSLLGAAVLVRLARGMPVTNTDFFEVDEMRNLTAAVTKVYRSLIFLLSAIVVSLVGLVFIGTFIKFVASLATIEASERMALQQGASAVLVTLIAYALSRTISLVRGDYDLVKLQARLMERVVERRHASERRRVLEEAAASKPFEPREGYGQLHQ